jgi:hypothetical protein
MADPKKAVFRCQLRRNCTTSLPKQSWQQSGLTKQQQSPKNLVLWGFMPVLEIEFVQTIEVGRIGEFVYAPPNLLISSQKVQVSRRQFHTISKRIASVLSHGVAPSRQSLRGL